MSAPTDVAFAEHAVLGAVFAEPHLVADLPIEWQHFSSFAAQHTWKVLCEMHKHGAVGGDIVIAQGIAERMSLPWKEIEACLLSRLHLLPEATSVFFLAASIRERHERARFNHALAELIDHHNVNATDFALYRDEVRALADQQIAGIVHAETGADTWERSFAQLQQAQVIQRVPTGIAELDRRTSGGWRVGVVNVIAARPGQGKSTMTVQTIDANIKRDNGVHVFSLEDSAEFLMYRLQGKASGVSIPMIQNGMVRPGSAEYERIESTRRLFRAARLMITDGKRGALTVHDVIGTFRAMRAKTRATVCIVDYLGMVRYRGAIRERHLQVADMVQALADFAQRDNVAVVLVAQLNRSGTERRDPRPMLSDLKESGAIEEKAKLVVGLYRGAEAGGAPIEGIDYVKGETPPSGEAWARTAHILILKNTAGKRDVFVCEFDGEKGTII